MGRERLGLFAHYLHIRPWEIDLLSVEQFIDLCAFVDKANEQSDS